MALKIAVLSQKGGTGKTTAVRHLTEAFRDAGLRVLAIDLDPQGNLSDYFNIDPEADPTIGDVLGGRATMAEAIHDDVVPASRPDHIADVSPLEPALRRDAPLLGTSASVTDKGLEQIHPVHVEAQLPGQR